MFTKAMNDASELKFKTLGELYGYPNTAIQYFITENIRGERYLINYHGLKFVCKRTEIKKIEAELLNMYGLPLNEDNYVIREY